MSGRETLTFHWPERGISFLFPGFLLFSLFLHLFGFYLFQIVYPPSGPVAPPPASVTLLDARNPAHAPLLHWIESEDPALTAAPRTVDPPAIMEVHYPPSYAARRAMPLVPPLPADPAVFPPARPLGELVQYHAAPAPTPLAHSQPVAAPPTRLRLSPPLEARKPPAPSKLDLGPVRDTELRPTIFLAGVDPEGVLRHLFLQSSSGNKDLDDQARRHLRSIRFSAAPDPGVAWGHVSFFWGADASIPSTP